MEASLGFSGANSLRLLLYHDIAPADEASFETQLRWLKRTWDFITPQQFESIISGNEPVTGRKLLLTFDDGFASNRIVAEKILNPLGIKALFFAISGFVDLQDKQAARNFIVKNIIPGMDLDKLSADQYNMGWKDLTALLEQGHSIGAHTATHARLSAIDNGETLNNEIVKSADKIAARLGVPIDHFAYTFGDLNSFSKEAFLLARNRYKYIYTGLRGNNARTCFPQAIWRDSINVQSSLLQAGGFLEGAADMIYSSSRRSFQNWVSGN